MNVTEIPMNEVTERFRRYLAEERKLSPRTVASYSRTVRKFIAFKQEAGGALHAPTLIAESDITSFLRARAPGADRQARGAWNLQLTALGSFFAYLIKEGLMDNETNPAEGIKRVKVRQAPADPPSLDEVLTLIDVVEAQSPPAYRARNVLIVQLLFHCSLRVSELVSLDLEQVQMEPAQVGGYRLLGVRRKGGKEQHIVFNDVVATAIARYLEYRATVVPEGETALLLSDRRKRVSTSAVRRMIRRYAEIAGIRSADRRVSPHTLRHASATEMERDGARPRVIQEHLGHASIQTTQRYLHTNEDEQRLAVDGIGARFKQRRAQRASDQDGRVA